MKKIVEAIRRLNLTCKIAHTDLVPCNIMINTEGKIIIIDFDGAKPNTKNYCQAGWIIGDKDVRSHPILPFAIKQGLIDLDSMIAGEHCSADSCEITFNNVIQELNFLIAMVPLTQPVDEKAFDNIKQELKQQKILQKAAIFGLKGKLKDDIVLKLLEEKLDLAAGDYMEESLSEVVISLDFAAFNLLWDQFKKADKDILLKLFQDNRPLKRADLEKFKHFFPQEFKRFVSDIKVDESSERSAITFLVDNGAKVPCFEDWKKMFHDFFSSHQYGNASQLSQHYFVPVDKHCLQSVISHIKAGTYPVNPQFFADIVKYFPQMYVDAYRKLKQTEGSDFVKMNFVQSVLKMVADQKSQIESFTLPPHIHLCFLDRFLDICFLIAENSQATAAINNLVKSNKPLCLAATSFVIIFNASQFAKFSERLEGAPASTSNFLRQILFSKLRSALSKTERTFCTDVGSFSSSSSSSSSSSDFGGSVSFSSLPAVSFWPPSFGSMGSSTSSTSSSLVDK